MLRCSRALCRKGLQLSSQMPLNLWLFNQSANHMAALWGVQTSVSECSAHWTLEQMDLYMALPPQSLDLSPTRDLWDVFQSDVHFLGVTNLRRMCVLQCQKGEVHPSTSK